MTLSLDQWEKKILLKAARHAIAEKLGIAADDNAPKPPEEGRLKSNSGAFVTLTIDGELRGCIGHITADKPLFETVISSAKMAAFSDSRFPSLDKNEFGAVSIEISAMSEPSPVPSYSDIEIGRHGIIIIKNGRRALFLPKVAQEQGWDIETTLTHLALKAGLDHDDWRQGASFEVFEAEVFAEDE